MDAYASALDKYIMSQGRKIADITKYKQVLKKGTDNTYTPNTYEPNHPLFELSDLITKFLEGEKTEILNKDNKQTDLDKFFEEKGKHFCVGYLSKFGTIRGSGVISQYGGGYASKRLESKAHDAALKYYMKTDNTKNNN